MITAVIKARNETRQLAECFSSLKNFADEIILIDDNSTDNTAELARSLGAIAITITDRGERPLEWLDTHGFKAATHPWILQMDADERMTPQLGERLKLIAVEDKYNGVRYARKNIIWGAWIRYGGWFMADQLRFFKKDAFDQKWNCGIHTQPLIRGNILTLPAAEHLSTLHLDYDSIEQFVRRTLLSYARTEALMCYQNGRRFSLPKLLFKPCTKFIGRYVYRQGFRDGIRGFLLAFFLAIYEMIIEAHLWDFDRKKL